MDRDIGLRVKGVDEEAVASPDCVFVAQVEDDEVFVEGRAALDLLLGLAFVLDIQVHAFDHVG